ncbi:MAG: class II fructose-bisphosphate aldolase, partial [Gammaproteobacteria bacterium]
MPLVDMKDLMQHAYQNRYAVGAFDVTGLDCLDSILGAAERCRAPVILNLALHGNMQPGLEVIMPAVEAAARRSEIPVAIHLQCEADTLAVTDAIRLGANSVGIADIRGAFHEQVRRTRASVDLAHGCGVPLEAGIGAVRSPAGSGSDQGDASGGLPTTTEVCAFLSKSEVDSLSLTIPCNRQSGKDKPKLEWRRLKEIGTTCGLPLAIEVGEALTEDQYHKLISLGVAKISDGPVITGCMDSALRSAGRTAMKDYDGYRARVRATILDEVERYLRMWGAAGRAAEVNAQCRPWLNAEHLLLFSVRSQDEARERAMLQEGRDCLSTIPGVRSVELGSVLEAGSRYQYYWRVRVSHPAALDGLQRHAAYADCMDGIMRSAVADSLGGDYQVAVVASEA